MGLKYVVNKEYNITDETAGKDFVRKSYEA
jgi:hypothetical protein